MQNNNEKSIITSPENDDGEKSDDDLREYPQMDRPIEPSQWVGWEHEKRDKELANSLGVGIYLGDRSKDPVHIAIDLAAEVANKEAGPNPDPRYTLKGYKLREEWHNKWKEAFRREQRKEKSE